jgi:hypothetical protein
MCNPLSPLLLGTSKWNTFYYRYIFFLHPGWRLHGENCQGTDRMTCFLQISYPSILLTPKRFIVITLHWLIAIIFVGSKENGGQGILRNAGKVSSVHETKFETIPPYTMLWYVRDQNRCKWRFHEVSQHVELIHCCLSFLFYFSFLKKLIWENYILFSYIARMKTITFSLLWILCFLLRAHISLMKDSIWKARPWGGKT